MMKFMRGQDSPAQSVEAGAGQIIQLARKRLERVEAEVARLNALLEEANTLRRIISAAS